MSRVKHTGEKKRLSLAKDHRVFALAGNKTFRKAWRLKKAKASRRFRRVQAQELVAAAQDQHGLVANVEDWPFSSFHRDNRDNPTPGDFKELNKALAKHAQSNGYGERPLGAMRRSGIAPVFGAIAQARDCTL